MHVRNQQLRYSHTLLETDLYARKDATSLNDENTPEPTLPDPGLMEKQEKGYRPG
jgi:hypothetical protein